MFLKCMGMERRVNSLEVVALFKLEAPQMVVEADTNCQVYCCEDKVLTIDM